MKYFKMFLSLLAIFSYGCVTPYQFSPDATTLDIKSEVYLKNKILSIEIFNDTRTQYEQNEILFNDKKFTEFNGSKICINSEENYKTSLNYQLSKITAYYLKNSLNFKNVVYGKKEILDFYLTGNLAHYRVIQNYSEEAAREEFKYRGGVTGQIGNIIFAFPIIAGKETKYSSRGESHIEFTNLKLYKKSGELIKDIGTIYNKVDGEFPADATCWCAFWAAENSYPEIAKKLLQEVLNGIENME